LDKDGLSKAIHDGDVVMVSAISTRFENAVKLQGNVARPMRYVWKQGMRITDVLKDANELLPQSYWEKQNSGDLGTGYHKKEVNWDYAVVQRLDQASLTTKLLAFNLGKAVKGDPIENMQLQSGDVITVYAADEDLPKTENDIVLKGSIFAPSNRRFVWREGMHINDLIPNAKWLTDYYDYWSNLHVGNNLKIDKAAQAEKLSTAINWGYANLVRLQPQDLTRMMLSFDLGKAVLQNDAANNLVLRPGDEITIFSNSEIHESGEREVKYITLEGEVKTPGVYPVGRGETLRQLIARLGGITSHAYLRGSVFTRESVREVQQKSLTEAIEKMKVELRAAEVQATSSAGIKPEELVIVKTKMAQQQATLDSMSKIKAAGRIVLELPEEEVKINDLPDLALEDGDKISVPAMPSTVSVMGNVYNQSTFIFKPGNVVDDYLEKAGGATRDGDEKNIYVVLADGTVKANRATSFFSFNGGLNKRVLKPGDLVFVPQKIDIEYFSLSKAVMDWTQVFYQFVLGIAGGKAAGLW
jgi:protein involved in polysaccharide export with SLBB domain